MPYLSNPDVVLALLLNIEETTKEPHTLERVKEALRIVQREHFFPLMDLLLNIRAATKEPQTLESANLAVHILRLPPTEQWDGYEGEAGYPCKETSYSGGAKAVL